MKIFAKIAAATLISLIALAAAGAVFYITVTADARLQAEKLTPAAEGYAVYDAADTFIAELSPRGGHKSVKGADLPAYVRDAFICAEDKNFYNHGGLDYKGIARAMLANLRARSFRQGGSTISQQLVKNTQLTSEKTLIRKLREIKLTRQLEKRYSKDQILEMYLNTIYFGHACYGIAGASEFYFGKDAKDLTAAEGAMLAAVIRSPNNYSPFVNPEICLRARNNVLRRMRDLGKLSAPEYDRAVSADLPQRREEAISAQSYLEAVRAELEQLPVYSPYKFLSGCKIYTYMDARMQEYAENLHTDADRSGKSILIADNASRGVSAWSSTEGTVRSQPGSTLKPFIYAEAIEEGLLSPCSPLLDEQTDFNGYTPSDYKDRYSGWVSARTALAQSMNVPAVKVLNMLGTERGARALRSLGLTVKREDENLSLALGGVSEGFTLREIAGAYAALAGGGKFAPLSFIRKIEGENKTLLYERSAVPVRAFSEDTAALTIDMMQTAAKEGTAKKLSVLPFPVAAKTGTSGNDAGNTSAWTIACTALHTVGVWMGNADNSLTDITGGGLPCHYAMLLNKKLYEHGTPPAFTLPPSVTECSIDMTGYANDHIVRLAAPDQPPRTTARELFRKDFVPKENSAIYTQPHDQAVVSVKGSSIYIDLCHTQYYDYEIIREDNDNNTEIYSGEIDGTFTDKTVSPGKKYRYRIRPYYVGESGARIYGEEIVTPYVMTGKAPLPDKWWKR